jgi:hypothetical protein
LRLLGAIFLAAFLSLYVQLPVLLGGRGLLPAARYLAAIRGSASFFSAPTLFWLGASDRALSAAALAGAALSVALVLGFAPRPCLLGLWAIYLSFATVGQDFLSFQWDNLLLETAFFALFVAPGGLRMSRGRPAGPVGVFLMRWLLFRLNFESGLAKLLTGDPTWRNLTAMASYYETAPLPTWIGWYAHQMPLWAHRACSLLTLVVELGVALMIFGPRRARLVAFCVLNAMQLGILATANYGFFNYLTIALSLFLLVDGDLSGEVTRESPRQPAAAGARLRIAGAALLVLLSTVAFLPFFGPLGGLNRELTPLRRGLASFRTLDAYHLFAQMTLVRDEVVIEGSNDGATWSSYEFRYKAGDPDRAPRLVAPHQPRVDFQLWFLLLGGRPNALYFDRLLRALLLDPEAVAPLFSRDPFPEAPPKMLRVLIYRYRFTDAATRRATGNWWSREELSQSRPITAAAFSEP